MLSNQLSWGFFFVFTAMPVRNGTITKVQYLNEWRKNSLTLFDLGSRALEIHCEPGEGGGHNRIYFNPFDVPMSDCPCV